MVYICIYYIDYILLIFLYNEDSNNYSRYTIGYNKLYVMQRLINCISIY